MSLRQGDNPYALKPWGSSTGTAAYHEETLHVQMRVQPVWLTVPE